MVGRYVALMTALALAGSGSTGVAQIQYKSGQNVAPVFEGWIQNADGSFDFVFGYMNRNYEEVVDVPVGPDNNIQPAGPDRGQPTHFYPRRSQSLFRVRVAKNWDPKQKVVWTLTANGRTDTAKGWLQPEWEIESGLKTGKGEVNEPPSITGPAALSLASPGQSLALTVTATDDGVPKPSPRRRPPSSSPPPPQPGASPTAAPPEPDPDPDNPRAQSGLAVRWIEYRGPGNVTFESPAAKPVYGQPVTANTTATFSAPGTYVLWAIARDGVAQTPYPVTVTVSAGK
jgi:hypothetical protein